MHGGVRERARAALLADVGRIARRHLAEHGAADLSVRAISREMGLAPSALYRYYPSRDALLTQLIIEAYDELGEFVEHAAAAAGPERHRERFVAAALAIREWAVDHPHEYALIYGSPVPGYAAPEDTIGPATRVIGVLVDVMRHADPSTLHGVDHPDLGPDLAEQVHHVIELSGGDLDPHVLAYGAVQWATLFGLVSFELFGTFTSSFDDAGPLYRHAVELAATTLRLTDT
ncbi:MAG: TetR/AcrR family transcriptional regulator [Actinomycetota bacterium]